MPDFIIQNHVQGGQMDVDTAGAFIRTEDAGEPIQITVLSGSIYMAVGEIPAPDPAVSALVNEGESIAFGGDTVGSTPESIGIRASVGTASVRIFQGPFVSRGLIAAGGGGSGSPSLPSEFITNDADIYVHYDGDDGSGDGSQSNPYFSVQQAIAQFNGKTISGAQIRIIIEPDTSPTEDAYYGERRDMTPFWNITSATYTMAYCDIGLRDITIINGGGFYIGYGLSGPSFGPGGLYGLMGLQRVKVLNGVFQVIGFRGVYGFINDCLNVDIQNCAFGYDNPSAPFPFPILRVLNSQDVYLDRSWFYGGDPGVEVREQSSVRCYYTYCHSNVKGVAVFNGSSAYIGTQCKSGENSPYAINSITKVGASEMAIQLASPLPRYSQALRHIYVSGAAQSQNNGFFPVPSSPRSLSEPSIIRATNNNCVNQASPGGTVEPSQIGPALLMSNAGSVYIIAQARWLFRGTSNYSSQGTLIETP